MRDARLKLREMIDLAKEQERKAIINEDRRRHASASGACAGSSNGGTSSPAAAAAAAGRYDGKSANGGSVGRHTQSSTGAPFAPGRPSMGTGAGGGDGTAAAAAAAAQRSKRPQGKPGSSGAQPKPFDQMRQTFVEDTLTDFFGL